MKFIGITGGVGAGKSEILRYIEREYQAYILLADELAHELMQPGTPCFRQIRERFKGEDIFQEEGGLDKRKLAGMIFSDEKKRRDLNAIVHPAVKREICRRAEEKRRVGQVSYFILEAALLIEEGYGGICDELWYIDASESNRRKRLKENRGYSDAKIDAIFESQLTKQECRDCCRTIIDNNGTRKEAFLQIREAFAKGQTEKKNG